MKRLTASCIAALLLIWPGVLAGVGAGVRADQRPPLDDSIAEARQGNSAAQLSVAVSYRDGKGVERDPAEAMRWGHLAADHGYAPAMDFVGYAYKAPDMTRKVQVFILMGQSNMLGMGRIAPGAGKHADPEGTLENAVLLIHGGASNSHYNGNAETYMDVGEAMGKAMADLLKDEK